MKSKSEIDKLQKTFEYLMKNYEDLQKYDFSIDIDFSYYGEQKKLGEYMLDVQFINEGMDPDIESISYYIKSAEYHVIQFLKKFSFDENLKIVSNKQYPNVNFQKYLHGGLVPNIEYSFSDELLKFRLHIMVESIPVDNERENQ